MGNVSEECIKYMIKSLNNNFTGNKNDGLDDYYKYVLINNSTLSKANLHTVENSTADTQKRPLSNALPTAIPNRVNPGIVLISTKLNQSDENKHIHCNVSRSGNKTLNSEEVATKKNTTLTLFKQCAIGSSTQTPKTATILVSKSKSKTGLPLLLKKSK